MFSHKLDIHISSSRLQDHNEKACRKNVRPEERVECWVTSLGKNMALALLNSQQLSLLAQDWASQQFLWREDGFMRTYPFLMFFKQLMVAMGKKIIKLHPSIRIAIQAVKGCQRGDIFSSVVQLLVSCLCSLMRLQVILIKLISSPKPKKPSKQKGDQLIRGKGSSGVE